MRRKNIYKSLALFFSLLLFINLSAQPPSWSVAITSGNHSVLVQATTTIDIDGNSIDIGDYVGAFYDSAGTLACAGFIEWQGVNDAVTIWGDDGQTTFPDGMSANEVFKWKIYDVSANMEYDATAGYELGFPNSSTFAVNGISGLASLSAIIQTMAPSWNFPSGGGTGSNHTILVLNSIPITIDGTQVVSGDYVGVFFDSLGTLACAGYTLYEPSGGNMSITAWGADLGNDGFQAGETFKWKIWRQADNTEFEAIATYQTIGFPNQGIFSANGISGLATLIGVAYLGTDLEISDWIAPLSACGTLGATEQITVQVTNVGNAVVNSFDLSFSTDGGLNFTTETVNQTINIGASLNYTFLQTVDMSLVGSTWMCSANVAVANDTNYFNNDIAIDVGNYLTPIVSMSGLQTSYCYEDPIDTLVGTPAGGIYTGIGVASGLYFPTNIGVATIVYTVSNPGCSVSDSMTTEVFDNPIVDLTTQPTPLCDGDIFPAQATAGYASYLWSDGSANNTLDILVDGTYSVTVTSINGCSSADDVMVEFTSLPTPNFPVEINECEGATVTLDAGPGSMFYWNYDTIPSFTQFLIVDTTGSYWVEVVYMGCSGFDTVEVTFNPNPVALIVGESESCEGETVTLEVNVADFYSWSTGETTQVIDVTASGTYSCEITNIFGCSGTDSHNVTFFPNPSFSIVSTGLLCEGETITLTADIAVPEYSWFDGSTTQSIEITSSGTYDVTVTDNNGCSGTNSIWLELSTPPVADFTVDVSWFEITTTNNSTAAVSYSWDFGDGNTSSDANPVHLYSLEGVYTITLIAENECGTDTSTYEVTLTSINSSSLLNSLSINPNPSNGKFMISINDIFSSELNVRIHNLIGQEIFSASYEIENGSFEKQIELQDVSKGVYLIKLITDEGISSKRLIIE
ncbi:MAG: T9SS type A sorting domain-containing protein [Bacteroidetes bacterium]|jgi:hypothetical protein|nr:T9SS type A sorting domain-containing protein [Bacteroidota bacterium]MBT6685381.1 T9SS type A sorting domain-containing protein [Bacteroidota bacterium]MBT7145039.1 T9SS type A sorting domain-containing protein [Bacteroidota bacterium]MBT7492724.1 T9SS type A sorting domain-containing protein [Bacteroidota bacterium]